MTVALFSNWWLLRRLCRRNNRQEAILEGLDRSKPLFLSEASVSFGLPVKSSLVGAKLYNANEPCVSVKLVYTLSVNLRNDELRVTNCFTMKRFVLFTITL